MSATFAQAERLLAIDTPLGADVLLLAAFSGEEALSRPFSYRLELLSARDDIAPKEIVGKAVSFSLRRGDERRPFHGYVSRLEASSLRLQGLRQYCIEVVPWLWFLTRTADCRIFQHKSVPQILEQVFQELGFSDFESGELQGHHPQREYCVQYRESDFNFVSRLMEQEGIFYWFRHEQGRHVLVLADHKGAYVNCPEQEVEYLAGSLTPNHIHRWQHQYSFQSGRWAQCDYNFETPSLSLLTSTGTLLEQPGADKYEIYDYPGGYPNKDDGEPLTRTRMEETEAAYDLVSAAGSCRSFHAGGTFTLTRHEAAAEQGKRYLITAVQHSARDPTYLTGDEAGGEAYSNRFTCIPAEVVFRPAWNTPKPVVRGPQTAVVVGPAGEEIYTDKYGRVKVQFHWDRAGKKDEHSSCWIRVSHPWAGKNWGHIAIPRIGQEVVVSFLEGDPDRPLITGRVYNAEQMPPYELPANKTQSGVKSRSSLGGGGGNCNEIRFEDKKGAEQLLIHAEKNQDIEVENDESHWVGHDRKKTIDHDETTEVKHDRTETVGHDETITIGNNRTEKVGVDEKITIGNNRTEKVGANETITIGNDRTEKVGANERITITANRTESVGGNETIGIKGNRSESVDGNETIGIKGNRSESVGGNETIGIKGNRSESVDGNESVAVKGNRGHDVTGDDTLGVGKKLSVSAGDQISLITGSASLVMKNDGTIVLKGKDITIRGSGKITVKADGDVIVKGSQIHEN